jgi:uncharacterized protein (TIGR02444 family)
MPIDVDREGLWDFSVRSYSGPGVAKACLSLQNELGTDVNMLMFCCWAAAQSGRLDGKLISQAYEFSTAWADAVVLPLRNARTWMKSNGSSARTIDTDVFSKLRDQIKNTELLSEKLQLQTLESLLADAPPRDRINEDLPMHAATNLALYAVRSDIAMGTDARQKLSLLVISAFPNFDEKLIEQALLS